MPVPATFCEAEVLPGLEPFAADEMLRLVDGRLSIQSGSGALRFGWPESLDPLLDLRSVTALYLGRSFPVPRPKALLSNQYLSLLLDMINEARQIWTPRSFQTLRLSAAGEQSVVMRRLRDELATRTGLTPTDDDGDLLVRVRPSQEGGWEALVRLSPRPLATRSWRACNLPGALNACIAHVMMQLTAPRSADRLLNIGCGSATLLIERLLLAPARSAIGCDTNPQALDCAKENLQAADLAREVQLEAWDATALPLPEGSIDVICGDLPYGQLVGSHDENQRLYPALLAEAARVAAPGARMALITHELRLLEQAAARVPAWQLQQQIRVRVSGVTPGIFLFLRR